MATEPRRLAGVPSFQRELACEALAPAAGGDLARVLLVVFTLNEERGLPSVLFQAARLGVATVVVDGGSTDHTVAVARAFGVPVVPAVPGKGRAWRAFLESGFGRGHEFLAMVDGDGTYDLSALPALLAADCDMCIAMRRPERGSMTLARAIGNRLISGLLARLAGAPCPDALSGFRVIRRSALEGIAVGSDGFELEAELTLRFLRAGRRVGWSPVAYLPRLGRSKLSPLRDGAAILRTLLRVAAR